MPKGFLLGENAVHLEVTRRGCPIDAAYLNETESSFHLDNTRNKYPTTPPYNPMAQAISDWKDPFSSVQLRNI